MSDLVLAGGVVVRETDAMQEDILIEDGRIAAIGHGFGRDAVLDVSGCYVLPGVVDPHVHTSLEGHAAMEPLGEDLEQATAAALMGGVTTVGGYVQRTPDHPVPDMIRRQIDFGKSRSATDFFLNTILLPGDDIAAAVEEGIDAGVTTFKLFMAYSKKGLQFDDGDLFDAIRTISAAGGTVLVHAENGAVSARLEAEERAAGNLDHDALLRTAPGILEAEGMYRAGMFARLAGATLLFVHLSSKEGAEALVHIRSSPGGGRIHCETQPHYLCLTNEEVIDRGPLGKVGPPLKNVADLGAVWSAVLGGSVSHLSSDHSPRTIAMKTHGDPSILDAPYGGISGTELLLPLAFALGVETGRFDIVTLARLVATNAARRYGIYPRKGVIQPGSDADFAVVPIGARPTEITPGRLHGVSDYTLFRGMTSAGFPKYVIRNGQVVVTENRVVDSTPAMYLKRTVA